MGPTSSSITLIAESLSIREVRNCLSVPPRRQRTRKRATFPRNMLLTKAKKIFLSMIDFSAYHRKVYVRARVSGTRTARHGPDPLGVWPKLPSEVTTLVFKPTPPNAH
jgi:hypothetical protein